VLDLRAELITHRRRAHLLGPLRINQLIDTADQLIHVTQQRKSRRLAFST